jgi:hypothetical protein
MSAYITVAPGYGREYKSGKAAKADWDAGKDFIIVDILHSYYGRPINKQDAEESEERIVQVNIRFAQMRKFTVVKTKGKKKR